MRATAAIVAVCGFTVAMAYATLGAQAKKTASAGVYTADQATRGEAIYKAQCAACHGDNMEGSGPMPPLAGIDFLNVWQGRTVGELYEKTQTTMPATAPGTLTPPQAADVVAYMLRGSKYPAGAGALEGKMEALLPITIDSPAAAQAAAPVAAAAPVGSGPSAGGAAAAPAAGAPAARAASAGVYVADQATRGEVIYREQCAACHGDNLEGSGPMPPLAGPDFLTNWRGKTLGELYEKTQTTMPATAPGTLTPAQTADLLAYTLKVGQYPAGQAALEGKMEALLPITIDAPK